MKDVRLLLEEEKKLKKRNKKQEHVDVRERKDSRQDIINPTICVNKFAIEISQHRLACLTHKNHTKIMKK